MQGEFTTKFGWEESPPPWSSLFNVMLPLTVNVLIAKLKVFNLILLLVALVVVGEPTESDPQSKDPPPLIEAFVAIVEEFSKVTAFVVVIVTPAFTAKDEVLVLVFPKVIAETVVFTLPVIAIPAGMITLSAAIGTIPPDQEAGEFQLPPKAVMVALTAIEIGKVVLPLPFVAVTV